MPSTPGHRHSPPAVLPFLFLLLTAGGATGQVPLGAVQTRVDTTPPAATVPAGAVTGHVNRDSDTDGIPDRIESQLLATFTPYFRYSNDGGVEQYRPMDAWQYVQWSELQTDGDEGEGVILPTSQLFADPTRLLWARTSILNTPQVEGGLFLNPLADVPTQGGNWARYGWDWPDVLTHRNVGLYGHVVPFRATAPQTDFLDCPSAQSREGAWASLSGRDYVQCNIDLDPAQPRNYYKVEYWQFFGYNGVGKPFDFGDHEGDWTTVQVLVDAETLQPLQVHHFAHGYRIGFDLQPRPYARELPPPGVPPTGPVYPNTVLLDGGAVLEYRGIHYGKDVQFTHWAGAPAAAQNAEAARAAQNNVVRMLRDPETGAYSHPVVYVEHGGHEFWPTEAWGFKDSPNHNGDDTAHSYLAAPPPNLGEVEAPLAEARDAPLILHYNGRWGAYNRRNVPPHGPPLHNQWTWPASSSIRWQIIKDGGYAKHLGN